MSERPTEVPYTGLVESTGAPSPSAPNTKQHTPTNLKSLLNSEHLLRQAARDKGLLELGMQRIDVRCAALDSICTQSVLVLGFAIVLLAPEMLDGLRKAEDGESVLDVAFAACCVASTTTCLAASLFAIHISLYVGYKAQFAALQGKTASAVRVSLQLVLRTNEKAINAFNISLASLTLSVVLIAFTHTHGVVFCVLIGALGYFVHEGSSFRKQLDEGFTSIGEAVTTLGYGEAGSSEPSPAEHLGTWAPEHRALHSGSLPMVMPASVAQRTAGVRSSGVGSVARAFSGRAYKALRDPPMNTEDVERASIAFPISLQGWMYKSPSRLGPSSINHRSLQAAEGPPRAATPDKRFFVLRGRFLKWYTSEDDATLAVGTRSAVDLQDYCLVAAGDAAQLTLALVPNGSGSAKKGWFLRAIDERAYESWAGHLVTAIDANE
jgi:hypothetical protein